MMMGAVRPFSSAVKVGMAMGDCTFVVLIRLLFLPEDHIMLTVRSPSFPTVANK